MEGAEYPESSRMKCQKFILISTCSGYRNTGLHVFCPQRVGNAMQGGRQLTFIFLCSFSFSLWTKLSATGSIITEDRIKLLWLQCFSWFLWRCSDRSLFEKQGKADSSRGPQKIYSNHQGSCHKEGKQGEFLPLHTQLWILEFIFCLLYCQIIYRGRSSSNNWLSSTLLYLDDDITKF